MTHAEAGDHERALEKFEEALAARERIGDIETIQVARWLVAGRSATSAGTARR